MAPMNRSECFENYIKISREEPVSMLEHVLTTCKDMRTQCQLPVEKKPDMRLGGFRGVLYCATTDFP